MLDYFLHILIVMGIYIMLATSYNLLIGYTGLFSLAHAAFYGIGAYVSGLLCVHLGLNFLFGVVISMVVVAAASFLLAIPALRMQGEYLVIGSFGFVVIVNNIFLNLESITMGPHGLAGIAKPEIFGFQFSSLESYVVLVALFVALVYFAYWRLVHSPLGRVLKAIREDEVATASLGKDVLIFKVLIFVVTGVMAGIAGVLYAHYYTYVSPYTFTVYESVYILSMVFVGGPGIMHGSAAGAIFLVTLNTILKFIRLPGDVSAPLQNMMYGASLILVMMFRPQGLLGKRKYGSSIWESKKMR